MMGSKIDNLLLLSKNKINVPFFIYLSDEEISNNDFSSLDNLSNGKYSVRSSCSIEDGEDYSFAGQFDTYLNVDKKDLIENIKKVYESKNNKNVLDYIKKNKINIDEIKMNVIVQKMISSDISGVLFTVNTNGLLNETVMVAGLGLGEGIVGGKVDTTTYYYNLTDKLYYYEGKKDLLSKELIEELIGISSSIKDLLGEYLDIEFSIKDNKIYILQARKITTIKCNNPLIMDNSNIVESYPGISLPLTCSFVDVIYSGVFKGLIKRILKNDKKTENYNDVFSNMTGHVNGRVYYKISNWYELLLILPFSKKIINVWQEMLGVQNKEIPKPKNKTNILDKTKIVINYASELKKVPKSMDYLNNEFIEVYSNYKNTYNKDLKPKEVIKLYNEIKTKLLDFWDITLINDMYTFINTALFKKRIEKKYKDKELANKYLSNVSNIESMKPIKELIDLCYNYETYSKKELESKIDSYIDLYGDRSLEELKLESETFRTNRKLLLERIDYYRSDSNKLENMYNDLFNKENNNLPELDSKSNKLLNKCMIGIANREISRLNRSRIFGMVRELILTLGYNFKKNNYINVEKDIFYLTIEEIFNNVDKKENLKDIVKERKEQYEMYKLLPSYSRLIFEGNEFNKEHVSINSNKVYLDTNKLKGTPCSSGIVEGEVLVITNPTEVIDVKDKILVTKMTDPGWVFLLTSAKGVLSEKGSLLSHTAIISRELHIPSIVGIDSLMDTLKTGDIVKMNGNTGTIEIIKRSK